MRSLFKYLGFFGFSQVALVAFMAFASAVVSADILPEKITPEEGKEYYTRYNFKYEKNRHVTTNYWRGIFVPINTKVTLISLKKKKSLKLDIDGQIVTFVNARKHTQRSISEIAAELLSPTKISLKKVNPKFRDDLESGILRRGMTKEEVLITRGYPPRHRTPSTKSREWIYWDNRFLSGALVFDKDSKLLHGDWVN